MADDLRRLHLLRHAKSSWDSPSLSDHDRPLAPRGERAAAAMAEHLRGLPAPQLVLCSSARRTVETLARLRPALAADVPVSVEPELYGAGATAVLGRLRKVPDGVGTVLVIGHNPTMEDVTLGLAGAGDADLMARIRSRYPTGALATVTFTGTWKDLSWTGATLEAFVVPADLG